jgi:hypothetical protein
MPDNTSKSWNLTKVRCLAGSRANERPTSFLIEKREVEVLTILRSWREPDFLYFQVETHNRRVYDLRHHEYEDFWEIRDSAQGA